MKLKVSCADCGSTMNKVTPFGGGKKKYSYLRCKLYVTSGDKHLCSSHTIRLDELQDIFTEYIEVGEKKEGTEEREITIEWKF